VRPSSELARAWRGPGRRFPGGRGSGRARWLLVGLAAVVTIVLVVLLTRPSSGSSRSGPPPTTVPPTTAAATTTLPSKAVPIPEGIAAPVFSRIRTTDPVVFLTIDDGLIRDPAVLRFLEKHRIPVTLFLVTDPAAQGRDYFQRIVDLGATVQDHTIHHQEMPTLTPYGQNTEICKAADQLTALFGRRPWLFRPPGGKYDPETTGEARACGMRAIVLWSGSTNDGRLDLQHPGGLQPGDIILMHFRDDLRENLGVVWEAMQAAGLEPGRLEEYLPPA